MDAKTDEKSAGKCPVIHTKGHRNRDWWPEHLDIGVLHSAHPAADPMGEAARYFFSLPADQAASARRALPTCRSS